MIAVGELPTKACVKSMHAFCFHVHGFVAGAYAFGETRSTHSVVFRRLGDSELMHVMARSAKWDAETRRTQRSQGLRGA